MTATQTYKYNTYISMMQSVLDFYTLEDSQTAVMMIDLGAPNDDPIWMAARVDLQVFLTDYIISTLGL